MIKAIDQIEIVMSEYSDMLVHCIKTSINMLTNDFSNTGCQGCRGSADNLCTTFGNMHDFFAYYSDSIPSDKPDDSIMAVMHVRSDFSRQYTYTALTYYCMDYAGMQLDPVAVLLTAEELVKRPVLNRIMEDFNDCIRSWGL